ncbi:MAG TPA: hypothetical protein VHO24_04910 [Opitutaceae bacterium]|nr:hypothetical protein [Opitutaceae bacterium]
MISHPCRRLFAMAMTGSAVVGGVFTTGCATKYEMKVDSISQPAAKDVASYQIKTKIPAAEADTLRVQEAAIFIKTALSGKGLYEAPNPETADVVVNVDYGIEPPKIRLERSTVPVYAQTGGGVRYEQIPLVDSKGNATSRTVAIYEPPRTEMVGYQEVVIPVHIYEKFLRISAHENRTPAEGKAPTELWSVHVKSEDESKDLRKYLPLLASASADYIGKDTKVETTVKMKENDPGVTFVKKGM